MRGRGDCASLDEVSRWLCRTPLLPAKRPLFRIFKSFDGPPCPLSPLELWPLHGARPQSRLATLEPHIKSFKKFPTNFLFPPQASSSSTLRFYATNRFALFLYGPCLSDPRVASLHMRNSEYSSNHLPPVLLLGRSDRSAREGSARYRVCNWHQKSRASRSSHTISVGKGRVLVSYGRAVAKIVCATA